MRLQPIADRVIIKPDAANEKTETGLHIPDTAKERPQIGTIVEIGQRYDDYNEIIHMLRKIMAFLKIADAPRERVQLNIGDRVLYGRYAGAEIDYQEQKMLVMRVVDITAKIIDDVTQ